MLRKFFSIIVVALATYVALAASAPTAFAQETTSVVEVSTPTTLVTSSLSNVAGNELWGLSHAARIAIMSSHGGADKDDDADDDGVAAVIVIVIIICIVLLSIN